MKHGLSQPCSRLRCSPHTRRMEKTNDVKTLLLNLAGRIRQLRTSRGWTQEDMQSHGGFDTRFYQRLESGTYSPSLATLVKLANAFGVTVGDLFSGNS
ncbi:MAG: XRE family transcriptional regulator [Proteobacteria bacterium]|nr:MAG: XRE family transcriptional regulator [Pseudomonadota bacterium]